MFSSMFSDARKNDGLVDVLMELRRVGTTITAQTSGTGIASPFHKATSFDVVIGIAKPITPYTAGSAYWRFDIQMSDTLTGTYNTIESFIPSTGSVQRTRVSIFYKQLPASPNDKFVRILATPFGGVGGVDYYAFIAPRQVNSR